MEDTIKTILIGVSKKQDTFDYSMTELRELAAADNLEVVEDIRQNLEKVVGATYVGKGKVDEIKQSLEFHEATLVIANDELSPNQIRNLEGALGVQVLDRTGLILSIFATRAKSKEAQLQVEIARLKYEMPRLQSRNANYDQQGGGAGFANRGSGEKKIELDRRTIENQIKHLQKQLEELSIGQETRNKKRLKSGLPLVSLVGYTNAGKSTVMNGLIALFNEDLEKQVFEKDMLFATLDTSIREIKMPDKFNFLLSDTVGFVSKLPHELVKAFQSTLNEAKNADLLIHVIDYADPFYQDMMETTELTLKEIGITDTPVIYAYNKADLRPETTFPDQTNKNELVFSARDEKSLQKLIEMIKKELFNHLKTQTFLIPFDQGEWVSYLNENASVQKIEYVDEGTEITAVVSDEDASRLERFTK